MPEQLKPFISSSLPRPILRAKVVSEGGGWLLGLGVVVLLAALVIYVGLWVYQRSLVTVHSEWQEQIRNQESELRSDTLANLINVANSLAVGRELLSNHAWISQAFRFLEAATHAKVQFLKFDFLRDVRKIDLAGLASSYQTVAEQVRILESYPDVEKVAFGGLSRTEKGLVSFKLAITFKPSLLALPNR